jgi:hypothetical protein
LGAYKEILVDYLETVILPNVQGYTSGAVDYQIAMFDLIQDCLLANEKVTLTASSSVTGKEITYTLQDIETWYLAQ